MILKKTILANLNQIADLFGVQKAAVSKHLKNIFASNELFKKATVSKMETVQKEGNRIMKRSIEIYNLDAIIAVGYRVNSKSATQFRIWATKVLTEHITKGYTINKERLAKNYNVFMEAVTDMQALLPEQIVLDPRVVLDLVKEFASTWVSLDAYDKDALVKIGTTKKSVSVTADQLLDELIIFKKALIENNEATEIFGQERQSGVIAGIVGNVMQSFGGKALYPTIEEKAAHLLYFMVKNHPFTDGNKRSGAYSFI